jgi:hypothetical protein
MSDHYSLLISKPISSGRDLQIIGEEANQSSFPRQVQSYSSRLKMATRIETQ